jgi:1,4-dihydroxy-6-naphthoate synthase
MTPFDRIEDAVLAGAVDAGLLIHEGQLTYAHKGLHLWVDLGDWWFGETGLPLPLGGNAIRRALGPDLLAAVSRDLRASIAYGLAHRDDALRYALSFARGLDRATTDEFVGMYVNQLTLDYGERGRRAVRALLERGARAGLVPPGDVSFVDDGAAPQPTRC